MSDDIMKMGDTEETNKAFELPAIFVNKLYVHLSPAGVRLTFGEQGAATPSFPRVAVALGFVDAIALRDMLATMLAPVEATMKEAVAGMMPPMDRRN